MKFSAAATFALATLVSAQSVADVPSCAIPCLEQAIKSSTSCPTTDFACVCKKENFSAVQGAATSCVIEKCGADKAVSEVLPATQKLCAGAGKAPAVSSAAAAPSAPAPSAAASSAAASSAAPSAAAPTTSVKASESKAAVTDCPTTVATKPSASSNGTAAATSSVPVTAGAAGFAPIGGLAMLALGALAL